MQTRSKSGISKPVALAPAPEPPKPKAKKPTPAKPKTVRFSDAHQSRDSHRQQGARSRRQRSPSPRRDYMHVQAPLYGMPNVGHGYGLGFLPPMYGYPPYGYSPMGMSPMFPAPSVDRQQFRYGLTKRSRHESTESEDEPVNVVPAKRNRSKSSEFFVSVQIELIH